MAYYDLFIAPVPAKDRDDYAAFCTKSHEYFIELGALDVMDCWASDVPEGEVTSLPMAVKCEEGEIVTSGWVVWPDKAARDAGWGRMMQEDGMGEMPFDGKRMIFGGFDEIKRTIKGA